MSESEENSEIPRPEIETSDTLVATKRRRDAAPDLGAKFEVIEEIGRGGMGVVLKVRHRAMDRIRAVKLLHIDDAARDPEIIERFKREANIASGLSHPNIVRIHDFDHAPDGSPYIAMEYLEGMDLGNVIEREGPLGVERTVDLLAGVADALDQVHALGVVHRDLKPANLFLARKGELKILDFGISHVEWEGAGLTRTGDILGTPMYMSPEQLHGEHVDPRTDIYALAAVAYEMLTGHRAVEATNPAMMVAKILGEPPRPPTDYVGDLPSRVVDALGRGLAKDPDDRFQTAKDLLRALAGPDLEWMVETRPLPGGSTAGGMPAIGKTRRATMRGARLAAVVAAAVLVIGSGIALLFGAMDAGREGAPLPVFSSPVLVLPAVIDLPGVADPWLVGAFTRLTGSYLDLEPRLRVMSQDDARTRLGRDVLPDDGLLQQPERMRELADKARAASVVTISITREGDEELVRMDVFDGASGRRIWTGEARGQGVEPPIEELTWLAARELLGGDAGPVDQSERARCGTEDDDRCREVLQAEAAMERGGFEHRRRRFDQSLRSDPVTATLATWLALHSCARSSTVSQCMSGAGGDEPPRTLSQARQRLWRLTALIADGTREDVSDYCELMDSDDVLVRFIAASVLDGVSCESRERPYCRRLDTFPDRQHCITNTTMRDPPEVAYSYFESFAEMETAHRSVVSLFSMVPMNRDPELAALWLERSRLRDGRIDHDFANSMCRLELSRRDAAAAIRWGRLSNNPRWREGQALQLDGRIRAGTVLMLQDLKLLTGTIMDSGHFVVDVIIRPALQPVLLIADPALAEEWERVFGEIENGNRLLQEATATARLAREEPGGSGACGAAVEDGEIFAAERLYMCRRFEDLIGLVERRGEQSYAERASRFLVADAHLETGRFDEAERLFGIIESEPVSRTVLPVGSVLALERLGRIAEADGRAEQARDHYRRFLEIWSRTDVRIPEVERARAAMERLESAANGG